MKKQIKTYLSKEITKTLQDYFSGKENEEETLDKIVDGIMEIINENKDFQIDIKD